MSETLNNLLDERQPEKTAEVSVEKIAEDLYMQGRIIGRGIVDEMEGIEKEAGAKDFFQRMGSKARTFAEGAQTATKGANKGDVTHRIDRINSRLANLGASVKGGVKKGLGKASGGRVGQGLKVDKSFKNQRNWGIATLGAGAATVGGAGAGINALNNKQN